MSHSNMGYAGVVGALILGGAFAGCVDNGNDVGFEETASGNADNTAVTTGGFGDTGFTNTSAGTVSTTGGFTNTSAGTVGTTGTGYGGSGTYGVTGVTGTVGTTGTGYGGSGTYGVTGVTGTVGTTGTGYGGSGTIGNTSATGAGGAPAEATCGPEELDLQCEAHEICRVVDTVGPLQYSCEPNPCYDHNQANSCECAASVCGSEAPNCVMIQDDTVVACVCVLC